MDEFLAGAEVTLDVPGETAAPAVQVTDDRGIFVAPHPEHTRHERLEVLLRKGAVALIHLGLDRVPGFGLSIVRKPVHTIGVPSGDALSGKEEPRVDPLLGGHLRPMEDLVARLLGVMAQA